MQIIELDSFDTAFPVRAGEEDAVKRRFMTLFSDGSQARMGGTSYVRKVLSFTGEAFALKRMLASSIVPKDANLTPEDTARITQGHVSAFYEEYKNQLLVSRLQGFPRVYGYGSIGDDPCILMEWVEGISLRQLAHDTPEETPLPTTAIAAIGVSVLEVLETASRLDSTLVHRDLSPSNILIRTTTATIDAQANRGSYDICLIDFGSATADNTENASFTVSAQVWRNGTPEYAAPEMLTQDIPHVDQLRKSQAIDVFALCSVLYELYSRHTPWRVAEHPETSPYRLKTENAPEKLVARCPQDEPFVDAIMAGLAVDQNSRPSVNELSRTLHAWLANQGVAEPGIQHDTESAGDGSLLAEVLPAGLYTPESVHLEIAPVGEGGRRASENIPVYDRSQARAISRRSFLAGGLAVAALALIGGGIAARSCKPKVEYDFSNYPVATQIWSGEQLFPAMYSSSNSWVLCNETGKERVVLGSLRREPGRYELGVMRMFDTVGSSNRYGYVTVTENQLDGSLETAWLILPRYAEAGDFSRSDDGASTLPRLAAVLDDDGLWGYIDTQGNEAIAPSFLEARRFGSGYAAVRADGDKWGLIDTDGQTVVEPRFASLGNAGDDGFVPARESADLRWGYIDLSGTWAIERRFVRAKRFSGGLAACLLEDAGGLWGYIRPDGTTAISAQFSAANPFYDGLAAAQDATTRLWGFIDADGNWSVEPQFLSIGEPVGGLYPAHGSPALGYGPVSEAYDNESATFEKYYEAITGTMITGQGVFGCGYIDKNGTWVIAPKYGDTLIRSDD